MTADNQDNTSATATAGAAQQPQFRYIDRPDCEETFADTVNGLYFDGQSLRIEFAVSRIDEMKSGQPVTGRRYPAARLVLPPAAAIDLINKMQQIANALTQAGIVRSAGRAAPDVAK